MRSHFYSSSSQLNKPSSVYGDDSSVFGTAKTSRGFPHYLKVPKAHHSYSNLARNSNSLLTIDKHANGEPELKVVQKSEKGYHVKVDLNPHFLQVIKRPSSKLENTFSHQSIQRHVSPSIYRDYGQSLGDYDRLNGGSRVSMVNLQEPDYPKRLPPPMITLKKPQYSNQKLVVDLEGTRNKNVKPNNSSDKYIMKSLKASQPKKKEIKFQNNKENIEFDLCLKGTVNTKVQKIISKPVEQKVIKKTISARTNEREDTEERTKVGIPSMNIRPPKPPKKIKISEGMIENLNNVTYELEEEEEEMMERLLKNAPPNSFRKKINVERETEEIFGPLPKEEIEKLYAKEMINVDVISEKVHLELDNGMADLQLRLTFNKIVPVQGSTDTFKMTKVIVSKQILVDLRVTKEREKIYKEIMQVQKDGVLDKEYTWMLYRIFSTLADKQNAMGVSEGKVRIDKEVEEERIKNLNKEMMNAGANTDKKFKIIEDAFLQKDDSFENSHDTLESNDVRKSSNRSQNDVFLSVPNGSHKRSLSRKEIMEPKDYFSEANTDYSHNRINEASNYLHKIGDTDWTKFSKWLNSNNENRKRSHRLDVYNYLRPGGSRNYEYLIDDSYQYTTPSILVDPRKDKPDLSFNGVNGGGESISEKVLKDVGLRGGKHRERMRSYERGLDARESSDYDPHNYERVSRKTRYDRGGF